MSIPEEWLTAAAVAIHDADCPDRTCSGSALGQSYKLARAALEAAVPFIAAAERERVLEEVRASAGTWGGILTDAIRHAERERIRQLAIEHAAVYLTGNVRDGIAHYPFADLLEDTP